MPIGQLITLGIGTPSDIEILVLTGLQSEFLSASQETFAIVPGTSLTLVANIVYALPPRAVIITWQSTGAAILEVSNDRVNWITVDTAAGADTRTIQLVVGIFIRASQNVIVICKKKAKF